MKGLCRLLVVVMVLTMFVYSSGLTEADASQSSPTVAASYEDAPSQIQGDFPDVQFSVVDISSNVDMATAPSGESPSMIQGFFPDVQFRIVDTTDEMAVQSGAIMPMAATSSFSITAEWTKVYELNPNSTYKHFTTTFKTSQGPTSLTIQLDIYKNGEWQKARSGTVKLGKSVVADLSTAYPVRIWVKKASGSNGKCDIVTTKS